jgi:hypothetical protein
MVVWWMVVKWAVVVGVMMMLVVVVVLMVVVGWALQALLVRLGDSAGSQGRVRGGFGSLLGRS